MVTMVSSKTTAKTTSKTTAVWDIVLDCVLPNLISYLSGDIVCYSVSFHLCPLLCTSAKVSYFCLQLKILTNICRI